MVALLSSFQAEKEFPSHTGTSHCSLFTTVQRGGLQLRPPLSRDRVPQQPTGSSHRAKQSLLASFPKTRVRTAPHTRRFPPSSLMSRPHTSRKAQQGQSRPQGAAAGMCLLSAGLSSLSASVEERALELAALPKHKRAKADSPRGPDFREAGRHQRGDVAGVSEDRVRTLPSL